MANEIRLEVYTFRVRRKYDKEYINLDTLTGRSDFLGFFNDYCSSLVAEMFVNTNQKKSIQFDKNFKVNSKLRVISGIISSGEYGIQSDIVDRHTTKKKFTKTVDDLDVKPFYFLLFAPIKTDVGFIILQRIGVYGIHTIFTSHLIKFFGERFNGLIIDFAPFLSKQLARIFVQDGGIRELKFRSYNLPKDIADKLDTTLNEKVQSIELKITAKQNNFFNINNKALKFFNNKNAGFFDTPLLQQLGFNEEKQSKIKVVLGDNTRTIDLSDTGQIRPYFDIEDEVKKNSNGHPEFQSIDKIAKAYLKDLIPEIFK
jgi:hypothetical protein